MQIQTAVNTVMTPQDPNLHGIVHELIQEAAPLAVHNHNYIINNIPPDMCIEASGSIISSVLNKLFNTALRHTKNSVILVSAKVYGMVVLVQLKSKGSISPALAEDLGHACLKAQNTGGIIEMTQCESEQASIAYCFLNVGGAA
jgi:K+-sensing histidine kinase KdpD